LRRLSGRIVCLQCGAVYNINNNKPQADGVCDVCGSKLVVREDDRPEVIRERIRVYLGDHRSADRLLSKKKVLFQINGQDSTGNIFKAIKAVLDDRLAKDVEN